MARKVSSFSGGGGSITSPPPNRPTQVFQSPNGLLDFLGTKTVGHNPDLFSQVLQPSLNLMPFYLSGQEIKRAFFTAGNPAPGSGFIDAFVVPPGRAWIPIFHALRTIGGGAAGQVRAKPCVFDPGGNVIHSPSAVAQGASAAAASQAVTGIEWWINPVLMPAGFAFGYFIEFSIADAANQAICSLSYIELIV